MSYIRFSGTWYNTTGDLVTWKADILDTIADSGGLYNCHIDAAPTINYSGLQQDLRPGIFPTEYTVAMMLMTSPKISHGVTYGPTDSILSDLFNSAEGRFFLKLYKNDVHVFTGVILPDQCTWTDNSPSWLKLVAADGLYRLSTENYISEVGSIQYVTLRRWTTGSYDEFSDTPVVTGSPLVTTLSGSEWIMTEHLSEKNGGGLFNGKSSYRNTTYARYEQYQVESPGTGWVDQGGGLWAKELDYFNEVIVDESDYYHLTRDIDNTPFRNVTEYIRRAMGIIPCKDEYGEICMYDIVDTWWETGMYDFTQNPCEMMRLSERKFAVGNKWSAVIDDILKLKYMRLYYSDGRYHFEQISERGESPIDRYCYDKEGTFLETEEDVDLDIVYEDEGFGVGAGGSYKALAALKDVKITVPLQGSNLLENQKWSLFQQGSKYLARIIKTENDVNLKVFIRSNLKSEFLIGGLPVNFYSSYCTITIRVRVTNIETGITYHLKPVDPVDWGTPTWETDPTVAYFTKTLFLQYLFNGTGGRIFDFGITSEDLPGDNGDSFDVYVSVNFESFLGDFAAYWTEENPTKYKLSAETDEASSLTTVDPDGNAVNANQQKFYTVTIDPDNSVTYEQTAKFCDTGLKDDSIEIKSSGSPISWRKSKLWSRGGVPPGREILQLQAEEIASLRMVPLRIYSGSFLTSLISTQNRIQRGTYIYLPLSVSIDHDVDTISGDFVNVARTTPPDGVVTGIPIAGENLFGPANITNPDPDDTDTPQPIPMGFETDENIDALDTLSTCAIINTDGVFLETGTIVRILDTATGLYEDVILTADINPLDTSMTFTSHLFLNSYPSGSQLSPVGDIVTIPTNLNQIYYYKKANFTGTSISAPNFTFVDPEVVSPAAINKRYQVWRNGIKIYCDFGPGSTPERRIESYYFDMGAHTWNFYDDGLIGETILIIAY